LSLLLVIFPVSTSVFLSNLDTLAQLQTPVVRATFVPLIDPAVNSIESMLAKYSVAANVRQRVARAIVQSSQKYNIDPKLVASIVIVESRANPFAISNMNAVGIMQIHMPTWGTTADRENLNVFRVEDNIALGVRILKGYVARHGLWTGVMRYRGWLQTPESYQEADEYAQKVRRIYQPDFVASAPSPSESEQ
jgi:soluble lytic murein transglycosylase-like protein